MPSLIEFSKRASISDRMGLRESFQRIGVQALPCLAEYLKATEDEELRKRAIEAVGWLGGDARGEIPLLVDLVEREPIRTQIFIGRALEEIEPGSSVKIVEQLRAAWAKLDSEARFEMLPVTLEIGYTVIPILMDGLHDDSDMVKMMASRLLGQCGRRAFAAIPALRELVQHQSPLVRESAAGALRAIAGSESHADGDE